MSNAQQDFWVLATQAIDRGHITRREALLICRPGSRKERFWARHLYDLSKLVTRREKTLRV